MDTRRGVILFICATVYIFTLIMPFKLFVFAQENSRFRTFHFANNFADNRHPRFSGGESDDGMQWANEQVWLVYDSKLDSSNTEIYTQVRHRDETLWREPIQLTNNTSLDEYPVVKHINDKTMVVWQSNRRGIFDLMFSIYDGNNWSIPEFITEKESNNLHPELFVLPVYAYPQPDTVFVILIWERDKQLYWSQYSDEGWNEAEPVTTDFSEQANPTLIGFEGRVFLAWENYKFSNWDIFGSWLNFGSNKWETPLQLTFSEFDDRNPSIIHNYWEIGLIWQSNRDGDFDIYTRSWWQDEDSTFMSDPLNLSVNDSADVDPFALFIPSG